MRGSWCSGGKKKRRVPETDGEGTPDHGEVRGRRQVWEEDRLQEWIARGRKLTWQLQSPNSMYPRNVDRRILGLGKSVKMFGRDISWLLVVCLRHTPWEVFLLLLALFFLSLLWWSKRLFLLKEENWERFPSWKAYFFFFFLGCPEAIDLLGQLCRDRTVRKAVGKGWGNWSGRGSNLLPLAQRSKQVVFHLCCSLC